MVELLGVYARYLHEAGVVREKKVHPHVDVGVNVSRLRHVFREQKSSTVCPTPVAALLCEGVTRRKPQKQDIPPYIVDHVRCCSPQRAN